MAQIIPFSYEGISLRESFWQAGKPYFSARAIGEFLEYSEPVRDINRIVRRNPHIDDPRWSVVAKLATTDGKKYDTRLYDPIGLQLIMFKSNQPKAIQYQVAAAHLIVAYMNGELKPSKWSQKNDLLSAAQQILSLPQGPARATLVKDLAERDGVCFQTAYRRVNLATGQRLKTKDGHVIKRKDAGSTKYPEEKAQVLAYKQAHPNAQGAEIKKALGLTLDRNHISRWLREEAVRF